jgi:hypothetical protein
MYDPRQCYTNTVVCRARRSRCSLERHSVYSVLNPSCKQQRTEPSFKFRPAHLHRALYGLKQAAAEWAKLSHKKIMGIKGMRQSSLDPSRHILLPYIILTHTISPPTYVPIGTYVYVLSVHTICMRVVVEGLSSGAALLEGERRDGQCRGALHGDR